MKIAIIGAGTNRSGIGRYIAREFHNGGATVCAVLGTSADSAQRAAAALQPYGIAAAAYADIENMLAQEQPDAAAIASPAATHEAYLHRLLAAGAHVFCEKPFIWPAPDDLPARLERIFAQADARRLLVAMNSQWPFALPAYEELCGPLAGQAISACYVRLSPFARGGRMIPEALPHALSIIYAACGPGELSALTAHGGEEEMLFTFQYGFRGGTCRTTVRLTHQAAQPRSFELGFNEKIVTRVVEHPRYEIHFTLQGKKIKIVDPLALSVRNFISAVTGQGSPLIGRQHIADTMRLLKIIADHCQRTL